MTPDPSQPREPGTALSRALHISFGALAALLLLAMTALTTLDVVGRYLFNSPVTGAFELTELMLAALIFAGLPLATERDEHVDVDLLDSFLPPNVLRSNVFFANLISASVLAVLSVQLWSRAEQLVAEGTVTNSLALPLAPVGYLMSVATAVSALLLLTKALTMLWPLLRRGRKARPGA